MKLVEIILRQGRSRALAFLGSDRGLSGGRANLRHGRDRWGGKAIRGERGGGAVNAKRAIHPVAASKARRRGGQGLGRRSGGVHGEALRYKES